MSSIPKGFWALLAVSVALNMFCVGLMVGRLNPMRQQRFSGAEDDSARGFLRHSGLREAGPEVKQILRDHRDEVKSSMRALGESRERVREALRVEPYDRERVSRAFQETRERTTQMQSNMHQALIDVGAKLTPAQRTRMAESMWNHRKPGR